MLLCQLAFKVCAGEKDYRAEQNDEAPVPKAPKALTTRGHNALARENITKFVTWATAFGVDDETISFESEDLVSLTSRKHKALVLILDIARLAHHIILPACIVAEREHAKLMVQQREARQLDRAACAIQRAWRAYLAAEREKELAAHRAAEALRLAHLARAATLAQSWWRGTVTRREYAVKRAAVKQIQRSIRAALARAAFKKKLAAIQTIQNVCRMHLAKLLMRKKAEDARITKEREQARMRRAATVMQAGWRARAARLEYAATKRKVVALQSVVRAYLARQEAELRRAAVLQLQCVFRMYLAVQERRRLEAAAEEARVKAEQQRAAVIVQSLVRMHLVKLRLPALREEAERRRIAAEQARIAAEEAKRVEEEARSKAVAEAKAKQLAEEKEKIRRAAEAEEARRAHEKNLAEQRRLDALSKKKLDNGMMREDRHTFKLKFKLRKVKKTELPKHVDNVRASVLGEVDAPADDTIQRPSAVAAAPLAAKEEARGLEKKDRNKEMADEAKEEGVPVTIDGKVAKIKAGGKPVVNLNKAGVTDEQVDQLVAAIKSNALIGIHLDLEGNTVTDTGAAALATLLGENGRLASLKLGFNKVTGVGAATLAEQLRHDSTLKTLELTYNSIEDAGAAALATALSDNITLTNLGLYKCRIGDDGLWALAETLIESNSTVRVLALGMNRFGSGAFEVLCEAIRRGNLETVKIDGNDLRHDDAGCLADAIRGNATIKTLDLRANKIGNLGAKHLAAALADDECGGTSVVTIDIKKNKVTSRGVEAFVSAGVADRVSVEGLPAMVPASAAAAATAGNPAGPPPQRSVTEVPASKAEETPTAEPAVEAASSAPAAPSKRYMRLKEKMLSLHLEVWQGEHPGEDHASSADWAQIQSNALCEFKSTWNLKATKEKEENDALEKQLADMETKLEETKNAKKQLVAAAAGYATLDGLELESSALLAELAVLLKRGDALATRAAKST